MRENNMEAKISWNLSELFSSTSDPALERAIDKATKSVDNFADRYKGKIEAFSAIELLNCIEEFEEIRKTLQNISLFSRLSFAANMSLPETQTLFDRVNKLDARLSKKLAFLSLELGKLVEKNPEIIMESALNRYKHFLERIKRRVAFQLSEVEEQLIIEKDQFGVDAWEELQSKWLNTRMFEVSVLGEAKRLNYGEANGLFAHPDRATRKSAYKSIYGLLGGDGEIFASALRNICNDWMGNCERRKYTSAMESSLISNDTQKHIIENLIGTVEANAELYQKYLNLKASLLDLPVLGCHDILAPIPNVPELKFSFEDAKDLIIRAHKKFDEEYSKPIHDMFRRNHIDAAPRFGKRNGAFCAGWYEGKSAFILQSFTGTLNDVFTLAHEMGHAIHDYYAQTSQPITNMNIPSIVAETASIFSELLLTDLLVKEAKTEQEKRAVLCLVLDEAGMAGFQVTARVWFEQSLYESIDKGKFLDYKTICGQWTSARDRIFGKAVDWFPEMDAEWTMKPHYFMANYRFYNYPYVYAQLFVYALYEKYLKEGKAFIPKMKQALSAGSSLSPQEIAKIFELDINDSSFWQPGINRFEHFINALKENT